MRLEYSRLSTSLGLAAALAAAAATGCASDPYRHARGHDERGHYDRIHDRDHADYHAWNESEDRAYRRFLTERHRAYRDFYRLEEKEQREYWSWRHGHLSDDHDRR
jgi:hypothetical protein